MLNVWDSKSIREKTHEQEHRQQIARIVNQHLMNGNSYEDFTAA